MEASIHSKDDEKYESTGKTYRVSSDALTVRCYGGRLVLTATDGEYYCPQDFMAVTPIRDITRALRLELTAQDLKQILDAALRANLLEAAFALPTAKKPRRKKH